MKKTVVILLSLAMVLFANICYADWNYYYDDNGRLVKEGNEFSMNTYEYDSDGNLILKKSYTGKDNIASENPYSFAQLKYTYENGKLISKEKYSYEETPDYTYRYTYENENSETILFYGHNSDVPTHKTENIYENGKLISSIGYNTLGEITGNTPSGRTDYTYDSFGNIIEEKQYDAGDNIVGYTQYEYTYDKDGKILLENYTVFDANNNITAKGNSSHTYDKYGNETSQNYSDFWCEDGECFDDGSDSYIRHYSDQYIKKQWIEQRKLIYTVEEAARLSKDTGNTIKLRYK